MPKGAPKEIISFAIDPDDRMKLEAAITLRQKTSVRDRELNLSKWLREAVLEKLEREAGKKPSAEFIPENPRHASDSTPDSVNEDEPRTNSKLSGPRVRSARAAIHKLVGREKGTSKS